MTTKKINAKLTLLAILPFVSVQSIAHDDQLKGHHDVSIVQKQSQDNAVAQDIGILAKEKGVSAIEIKESLDFQEKFKGLFEDMMHKYPNKISRVWLEPAPAQQAYVEFVGTAPAIRTNLNVDIFGGGIFSFQEQMERANYLTKLLKDNKQTNFMTYYDQTTGLIKLEMKVENRAQALTLEALDRMLSNDSALDADEKSAFEQLSVAEIDYKVVEGPGEIYDFDHSRGGNWLRDDGFRECTSGWAVSGPNGDGIVTAAHCVGLNQFEESPSSIYGMTWRSQERGNGDVEYHTTTHIEPAEYWATSTNLRDVTGIRWTFFMFAGNSVCEYGRSSNTRTCNHDVISNNVTTTFTDGTTVSNLVRVSGDNSIGGDSGGPWSWGTVAWGVHSGSNGSTSVFTPVQRAQSELNITIKTQ